MKKIIDSQRSLLLDDMMNSTQLTPRKRLFRSLILLICLSVLLLTCLRIIGQGYLPSDDALRHVAKVISGKPWADILVVRPEIIMDSHPGWHLVLSGVRSVTGCDSKGLLNYSVMFLFLAFTVPPVLYLRRGEAWIFALVISAVFYFGPLYRLFYGRPYIVSMIMLILFCFLWERVRDNKKPWSLLAVFMSVAALATWIHGTWYLFTLPLFALLIARQWRVFLLMAGAMFLGVFFGATLTGHPVAFLQQMAFHAVEAFGKNDFLRQLVGEFQPFSGEMPVFIVVGGLLFWRWIRGEWKNCVVDNPVFYLAGIGWAMGFIASRFWTDWGWPALTFWVALEIQAVLEYYAGMFSMKRMALVGVSCLVFLLAVTNDQGSRWSGIVSEWPKIEQEAHRPWLPDEGGILYNDNMFLFYQMFFNNPQAPWRYTLGFEPIWMTSDNLAIYRHIQLTRGKDESYAQWVKKMTAKDRMILIRGKIPQIEGLEWKEVTPSVWSGRLLTE